jgi:adenylosuccinate synthase
MLKRFLLLSPFLLSGCVLIGGGAYQTMDTISTGATAVSYGTTGKGITDHAISKIVGKDCRMFNLLKKKQICRETKVYQAPKYILEENKNGLEVIYIDTTKINFKKISKKVKTKNKIRKNYGKPTRTIKHK